MQKKPIIIISVLCVISLVLGYLSGLKEEDSISNGDAETDSKKEPEFLKEGLVAYYPFNGNAKDESGNGHDGKVNGATLVADRKGESNSAYEFGEYDSIISSGLNSALGKENFTFSAWINCTSFGAGNVILSGGEYSPRSGGQFYLRIDDKNYKHKAQLYVVRNGKSQTVHSIRELIIGKWFHIIGQRMESGLKIFINGVQELESESEAVSVESTVPIRIGVMDSFVNARMNGLIDDVRIYNRALSADEVKALYEFEKAK